LLPGGANEFQEGGSNRGPHPIIPFFRKKGERGPIRTVGTLLGAVTSGPAHVREEGEEKIVPRKSPPKIMAKSS